MKNILISGAGSMIGRAVCSYLDSLGYCKFIDYFPLYHFEDPHCDLLDERETNKKIAFYKPHYIIHLAGFNGNLQFTKKYAGDIYKKTTQMGINILSAAKAHGVLKVLSVIPSCAYAPRELLKEEEFFEGVCHESVYAHGMAKRNLVIYGKILNSEWGTKYISVALNNCTGPYDSFDVDKTKVFGGLVKKFCDAVKNRSNTVECFGDGSPMREMIYSGDSAEGIVRALQVYEDTTLPLNIGHGKDYTIDYISRQIAYLTNFQGEIKWNTAYANGAMKKLLCVDRMKELLKWEPKVGLEEGLKKTIEFYRENYLDNC